MLRIFIILILFGCGKEDSHYINPTLNSYVQNFLERANAHKRNTLSFANVLSIDFCYAEENNRGICVVKEKTSKIKGTNIEVSKTINKYVCIDPEISEIPFDYVYVLYHELGHCVFDENHNDVEGTLMFKTFQFDHDDPEVMLDDYFKSGL